MVGEWKPADGHRIVLFRASDIYVYYMCILHICRCLRIGLSCVRLLVSPPVPLFFVPFLLARPENSYLISDANCALLRIQNKTKKNDRREGKQR